MTVVWVWAGWTALAGLAVIVVRLRTPRRDRNTGAYLFECEAMWSASKETNHG